MLQERVGDPGQPSRRLVVVRQYRLAADVARGRDHGAVDGIEQQLVKRAVRQEDADLLEAGGDRRGEIAVRPPSCQDDGTHRAGRQRRFTVIEVDKAAHDVETVFASNRKHDSQRLGWPAFAFPKPSYGRVIARITHQVVSADSLDGDNVPLLHRGDR